MVDAFSWTKGGDIRTFSTRAELYDHMIAVGDIIIEGDDAEKFAKHVEKRAKDSSHPVNQKANAAKARLEA